MCSSNMTYDSDGNAQLLQLRHSSETSKEEANTLTKGPFATTILKTSRRTSIKQTKIT